MKILLIGHRGVGKTALAKRMSKYLELPYSDLDQLIEERGASIPELFEKDEELFRQREKEAFENWWQESEGILALGAGFNFALPKEARRIWVRRETDSAGRIFLDRPRLNNQLPPLEEYLERFDQRSSWYAENSDETFWLPEGLTDEDEIEAKLLRGDFHLEHGISNSEKYPGQFYELRNDLQPFTAPKDKILYSYRDPEISFGVHREYGEFYDWALELGNPKEKPPILSAHERSGSLAESFAKLSSFEADHYKAAFLIESFEELIQGHRWWRKDPESRSFLPRSENGRWNWYRRLHKGAMRLNFVRTLDEVKDQPTPYQWLNPLPKDFGAVLGSPILHSRTPIEQKGFLAIDVRKEEWETALPFLTEFGLRYAAVTSPLKELAGQLVGTQEKLNTLFFDGENWQGTNTDVEGLEALLDEAEGRTAVWGGGGTKDVLQELLPEAEFFSARQGGNGEFETLVWAVGRSRMSECRWPEFSPSLVLDLNYSEDSPGREFAQLCGARYIGGDEMFRRQAAGQRRFWQGKSLK